MSQVEKVAPVVWSQAATAQFVQRHSTVEQGVIRVDPLQCIQPVDQKLDRGEAALQGDLRPR